MTGRATSALIASEEGETPRLTEEKREKNASSADVSSVMESIYPLMA
jgi:hypothetical protein